VNVGKGVAKKVGVLEGKLSTEQGSIISGGSPQTKTQPWKNGGWGGRNGNGGLRKGKKAVACERGTRPENARSILLEGGHHERGRR